MIVTATYSSCGFENVARALMIVPRWTWVWSRSMVTSMFLAPPIAGVQRLVVGVTAAVEGVGPPGPVEGADPLEAGAVVVTTDVDGKRVVVDESDSDVDVDSGATVARSPSPFAAPTITARHTPATPIAAAPTRRRLGT